jgi:two-component system response regulator HydG
MDELLETSLQPAVAPEKSRRQSLLLQLYPHSSAEYLIQQAPLAMGRDDICQLVLDHPSVSRLHARIEQADHGLLLQDMDSKNGCTVNREPVSTKTSIKPGDIIRLGEVVLRLVQREMDAARDTRQIDEQSPLIGGSSLAPIRRQIQLMGPTQLRIMITGESGTGKELVARELHRLGQRDGPFIAVNCAALPDSLVEAELFGHAKGAFTGADRSKPGLFEAARGGTLFLDEVTELPMGSQAKLLRAVESGEVRRVGAVQSLRTDCRIVSATNHDVQRDVTNGRFRGDLAARLAEVEIQLPPLRQRIEDLPLLIDHLAARAGCTFELNGEVMEALACYGWPLNVRELDNVVRMLDVMAQGGLVKLSMLPEHLTSTSARPRAQGSKAQLVLDTLRENGGNIRRTSQQLGVSRSYIYRCLDRSGASPKDFRSGTDHA